MIETVATYNVVKYALVVTQPCFEENELIVIVYLSYEV